jgi:hypothetical protein
VCLGGVEAGDGLEAGSLILIPTAFLLVAFFTFKAAGRVAVALCLLTRVLEDPTLGPFDDALVDSALGNGTEIGTMGIGISPLMLGMGSMKLSMAYNQAYDHKNLQKFDD